MCLMYFQHHICALPFFNILNQLYKFPHCIKTSMFKELFRYYWEHQKPLNLSKISFFKLGYMFWNSTSYIYTFLFFRQSIRPSLLWNAVGMNLRLSIFPDNLDNWESILVTLIDLFIINLFPLYLDIDNLIYIQY